MFLIIARARFIDTRSLRLQYPVTLFTLVKEYLIFLFLSNVMPDTQAVGIKF